MRFHLKDEIMNIKWDKNTAEPMKVKEKHGTVYVQYPAFEKFPQIIHGFSTRIGGVSQGIYASMNLSFQRGDKEDAVSENYRRIADAIGFDLKKTVCSQQTHTTNIRLVKEEDGGKGILTPQDYHDIDGLITDIPGMTLATSFADCVPLFFVDPVRQGIGLAHSGWRGTAGRMGAHMVRAMEKAFGSRPQDLYAAIGPSICQECYEVSEDVAEVFQEEFSQYRKDRNLLYPGREKKYQLNLWRANEIILRESGIPKEHISFSGICTCCNPDFLFSHRASHGKRGNLSAFLGLSPSIE